MADENKLFRFDRSDPSFELLETEHGSAIYKRSVYMPRPMENDAIDVDVKKNEARIKDEFRSDINSDFILRKFMLCGAVPAFAALINGMASSEQINDFVLRDGMQPIDIAGVPPSDLSQYAIENIFTINEVETSKSFAAAKTAVLEGRTAVFINGTSEAVLMDTRGFERRGVPTPQNESVIRGPHEAFNENIRTNITLLRRIVKCEDLVCEFRNAGGENNVKLGIMYRDSIVNKLLVEEVKRRLGKIKTQMILSSGTLEQLTEAHHLCPLPQLLCTERPDRAAAHLMQGHVVVLVDGSPFANVTPATLFTLMSTSEDSYSREPIGTIMRVIRYIGALICVLLPGVFLALVMHHQGMLSLEVISTLIASRKLVFVSLGFETLLLLGIFHLVREAGLRAPGSIGHAIGIIGGLIMGQAAVAANLVSAVVLILVALTGLGNFTIPDYSTQLAATYFRLIFVFAGWAAGLLGISAALVVIVGYMASLKSYGVPFLAPFAPKTYSFRHLIFRGEIGNSPKIEDTSNAMEDGKV